jgi:hypothetical protein
MSTLERDVAEERDARSGESPGTTGDAFDRPDVAAVTCGVLIGFRDAGQTPLVLHGRQPVEAALAAASVVDLRGAHIGQQVVLMFEDGDPQRPIIMGVLRTPQAWPLPEPPGQLEVDADGERLIVTAKEELVLRCGKSCITLHRDGKISIRGVHVVSHAAGVNRIRGGSVQLN